MFDIYERWTLFCAIYKTYKGISGFLYVIQKTFIALFDCLDIIRLRCPNELFQEAERLLGQSFCLLMLSLTMGDYRQSKKQ